MQNSPALDIREHLISKGVTTPMYISKEPLDIDTCITLYNVNFDVPDPKFLLDYPGIQVRSRSKNYAEAYTNIQEIFNILHGTDPFTLNTTRYVGITAQTSIAEIGHDANDRVILVANFKLIVEPTLTSQHRTSLD